MAKGRSTLEQVRRRGRWKALSSVQRYSKTFALTQFRARMPEKVLKAGTAATNNLKAELLRALRRRPLPVGGVAMASEQALVSGPARDVAAELMTTGKANPRRGKPKNMDADEDDGSGGLCSDETFGEDTGWWTE